MTLSERLQAESSLADLLELQLTVLAQALDAGFDGLADELHTLNPAISSSATNQMDHLLKTAEQVKREIEAISTNKQLSELERMAAVAKPFEKLATVIPTHEETLRLTRFVDETAERTRPGEIYQKLVSLVPDRTTLAFLNAGATATMGLPISATIFAGSVASGLLYFKNQSYRCVQALNYGVLTGVLAMGAENMYAIANHGPRSTLENALWLLGTLASAGSTSFAIFSHQTGSFRKYVESRKHMLRLLRETFDSYTKTGVVAQEAKHNLRVLNKIQRVEQSVPESVAKQLRDFDLVGINYLADKATYQDLRNSRLSYNQQPKQSSSMVAPAPAATRAYGQLRETREKVTREAEAPAQPVATSMPAETEVQIVLGAELQRLYRQKNASVGGQRVRSLVDLSMSKLSANPEAGVVIRRSKGATGRNLIARLESTHGLEPNTPIYKMQPMGAVRTLYTMNGKEIVLLEVLTHAEYDKKLK